MRILSAEVVVLREVEGKVRIVRENVVSVAPGTTSLNHGVFDVGVLVGIDGVVVVDVRRISSFVNLTPNEMMMTQIRTPISYHLPLVSNHSTTPIHSLLIPHASRQKTTQIHAYPTSTSTTTTTTATSTFYSSSSSVARHSHISVWRETVAGSEVLGRGAASSSSFSTPVSSSLYQFHTLSLFRTATTAAVVVAVVVAVLFSFVLLLIVLSHFASFIEQKRRRKDRVGT